jgi:hypothetical protein
VVEHSTPTGDRTIALDNLEPGTRYYFRVETATPLGVARSAVLSFRTADAPAPQPMPEPKPEVIPAPSQVSHAAPAAKPKPTHVATRPAAKPVRVAARPKAKPTPKKLTSSRTRHHDGVRTASR